MLITNKQKTHQRAVAIIPSTQRTTQTDSIYTATADGARERLGLLTQQAARLNVTVTVTAIQKTPLSLSFGAASKPTKTHHCHHFWIHGRWWFLLL
jgi:hypothetical protein